MGRNATASRTWIGTLALVASGLIPTSGRLAALRDDGPNARDYERIERGYYERLIRDDRPTSLPSPAPAPAPFDAGELATAVDDVREYVLRPDLVATHKGARWSTNALGMRDRPVSASRSPGSIRVGLVGDSIACGWGVDDGLGFEPIVEAAWDGRGGRRVEVLNFAVPGHAPGQRWEHFGRLGWETGPDLVIVEATLADLGWDERRLRVLLPRGLGFDAPAYRDALTAIGVSPPLPSDLKAVLRPHRAEILAGVYGRIVADCRSRGVPVAWVLLPRVGKRVDAEERSALIALARSAGFDRMADLSDTFDGRPSSELAIAPDDFHPNETGHALLAARLDAALGDFVSSLDPRSRPTTGGHAPPSPRPSNAGVSPR